jgi:hypothetical protein
MTQKEAAARAEKLSSLNPAPPVIAAMAKERFEELAKVQSDLLVEIWRGQPKLARPHTIGSGSCVRTYL